MGPKLFILAFLIIGMFSLVGCGKMTDEQKREVAELQAENAVLLKDIMKLKDKFDKGELSQEDVTKAIDNIKDKISDNIESMDGIKATGVSSGEIALYSLANLAFALFGRGLPSKGPFKFVRQLLGGSTRKD